MFRKKSGKRGFTLIEILMVIAIIGIVASVIVGLRPGNPRGLEDARRIASAEFRVAQSRALLGGNPDREPTVNERVNIRAGVLILNEPDDLDRHLRFIQPIVGGSPSVDKTNISDYYWYAAGEGVTLPQGVYFVPPNATGVKTRSANDLLEGKSEVTIDPDVRAKGQKFGEGKKNWYLYLFDSNGQTYMTKAVVMLAEGQGDPANGDIDFGKDPFVSGFVVHRSGAISFTRDDEEAQVAVEE